MFVPVRPLILLWIPSFHDGGPQPVIGPNLQPLLTRGNVLRACFWSFSKDPFDKHSGICTAFSTRLSNAEGSAYCGNMVYS